MLEGAELLFRNFSGIEQKYNREGDRNFCVIVPPELVEGLASDGWNVKTLTPRDEGDSPRHYLKVNVKFDGARPPKVVLITGKGRTDLTEDLIDLLDYAEIAMVDLIVRPYTWTVKGETGISGYLKTMFVTILEDALELKYAQDSEKA